MQKKLLVAFTAFMLAGFSCTEEQVRDMEPLQVVPQVDLNRYTGTWHEIARYPNSFQKDCFAATAEYSLRKDGKISVTNTCCKGSVTGKKKSVTGTAWSVDPGRNAKLKVRFFWPFSGNYWIIQLDEDYRHAVVGNPTRKYLWILSRTPRMDPETYRRILDKLPLQGYDPARIIRTQQP